MPSKDSRQHLHDILENIDAVNSFVLGLDFAAFCADRKTVYAATRALEIISEASRRLENELKARHPHVDWPAVAAAGNVYRNEYESVDEAQLRQTVQHELDPLRKAASAELER